MLRSEWLALSLVERPVTSFIEGANYLSTLRRAQGDRDFYDLVHHFDRRGFLTPHCDPNIPGPTIQLLFMYNLSWIEKVWRAGRTANAPVLKTYSNPIIALKCEKH
jgi:hypothetical protein